MKLIGQKVKDFFMERNNKNFLFISLLVCITFIVYLPTLNNLLLTGSNGWDDGWQVTNFYTEGGLNWENIKYIFIEPYFGQYSPINQLMYLLIYNIAEYNPFYYHLTSLLLHIINSCLVFFILKNLLEFSNKIESAQRINNIAFITTLFFALHPLQVEAVAWVSASKVVLFSLFYLIGTLTFIQHLKTRKRTFYFLTILCFILSYGSKEQALTFPVWILFVYWVYGINIRKVKTWLQVLPFFVLSIVLGLFFLLALSRTTNGELNTLYPLWQRFFYASYSIAEYFTKWFFPYKLLFYYPFPNQVGEALPTWLFAYPILLITILAIFWEYISHWVISTGLLFFLLHIALMLHIIPMDRSMITSDRYTYLASIGFAFIVSYLFFILADKWKKYRKGLFFVLFSIFVVLGTYSHNRVKAWHDSGSIKNVLNKQKNKDENQTTTKLFQEVVNNNKKLDE